MRPVTKCDHLMSKKIEKYSLPEIENRIFTIRDAQVMIDFHLADMYQVETKRINEQVRRNIERFPKNFMFQLNADEWNDLQSQIATTEGSENLQSQNATAKRRTLPYAFTEQGVAMLSAVLRSETAVEVSIHIIQAFVKMRRFISTNAGIFQRLDKVELKQIETDHKFEQLFKALEDKSIKPKQGIFFGGQMFDAYKFTSELIRSAKKSIILIDNYVDDAVLTLLSKRGENVAAAIYTKNISKQLKLDLKKHNSQYPKIVAHEFKNAHDRFLILDETQLYHFGASLKDLGKKWFAFSRMDSMTNDVLQKLKNGGDDE